MISISIYATLACCSVSAAFGYMLASILGRPSRKQAGPMVEAATMTDENQVQAEKQLKILVDSLYALTSQVDTQVGEHSLRVNEITNSLESPGETGPSMVLAAGKLLVSANQKLQADLEEAKSEIQRQRDEVSTCMRESRTQMLTNLANRRAFDIEFSRVFAQRRRDGQAFSLLMIDIDYFKRINDQYGHMVGDQLLKGFSRCLTNTFRECDFVARYGGEEFSVILSKTSLAEALKAAERVRMAIADNRIRVGELQIQITASIGVKEVQLLEDEAELIERTDTALYAAKRGGRNCCYYHDGTSIHLSDLTANSEASDPELPSRGSDAALVASESMLPALAPKAKRTNVAAGKLERKVQL